MMDFTSDLISSTCITRLDSTLKFNTGLLFLTAILGKDNLKYVDEILCLVH